MKIPHKAETSPPPKINLTFILGLCAILVGLYNLFLNKIVVFEFQIPEYITDLLLLLAGLFIWFLSYRLGRYKYHASRIF